MVSSSQSLDLLNKVARVDEVMRTKGWSLVVANQLAAELGCSMRTVYNLRNKAQRWTQAHMKTEDVARWRAAQLQLADQAAREALADKDYQAVAKLLQVGAGLAGTIAPTNVNVTHNVGVSPALSVKLSGLTVTELTAIAQRRDPGAEPEVVEGELVEPVESGK